MIQDGDQSVGLSLPKSISTLKRASFPAIKKEAKEG
jgi:hypothetical protein